MHAHFSGWQTGTLFNTEVEQTGQALIQSLAPPSQPIACRRETLRGYKGRAGRREVCLHWLGSKEILTNWAPPPAFQAQQNWGRAFIQMKILWKGERGRERGRRGEKRGTTDAIFTLTCIKLSGVLWKREKKHWKPAQLFLLLSSLCGCLCVCILA